MSLRPPREDEFDAMLALMNASQLAVYGEADVTADDLRTWLTTPYVDVARDLRVLERDGRLIGYADVDHAPATSTWWCDVKVAPDADADEALAPLVAWLDERAREGVLRVWTSAGDARTTGAFERLGFAPVRHSFRMELALPTGDDAPRPRWPDGVQVRLYEASDEQLVFDLLVEVWRDTSDPIDETFEDWRHWTTARDGFDPTLWFLAFEGDELAGFSLCRPDDVDASAGYVAYLGVRRPWRRRGLGEALLLHSFAAFRERGLTRATLGVDASSPTGATKLYERVGMSVYRDTVFLERAAAPR